MNAANTTKPVAKTPVAAKKPVVVKKAVAAKQPVAAKKTLAASKPADKVTASKSKAAAPAPAKSQTVAPAAKAVKPKTVRDSFTMREDEYQVLADLKQSFKKAGVSVKKAELLRVAVGLLKNLDPSTLKAQLARLPALKNVNKTNGAR